MGLILRTVGLKRSALAVAVALGIYISIQRPMWVIEPLRDLSEVVLKTLGFSVLPLGLWVLGFLTLLRLRPFLLVRKWRYVLGTASIATAALAVLTQIEGEMPLIGTANLGGSLGLEAIGRTRLTGWGTAVASILVGIWLMLPRFSNAALSRSAQGAMVGATKGSAKGAEVSVAAGRLAGRGVRKASRLTQSAKRAVEAARGPRREDSRLAQDFEEFLETTQDTKPQAGPPGLEVSESVPLFIGDSPAQEEKTSRAEVAKASRAFSPLKARSKAPDGWMLPPLALLSEVPATGAIGDQHQATARLIEQTLSEHRVEVHVAEIRPGPTVTMFGLVPGWNRHTRRGAQLGNDELQGDPRNRVRVDAILAREKDLALALAAPSLRIEAPVPGESVVGVEVPNKSLQGVSVRSIIESKEFNAISGAGGLPVALGQASAGEPVAVDLLSMPHLLIAGATGSGKSVCINSVLSSLIMSQRPDTLRLMLVDPKRVELTPYNGIPHLVTPVVVEPDRVVRFLRGSIAEMLRRYQLLEEAGVRNVQGYNRSAKATEHIPYLVICIDELADLMMTSSFDVEQGICRLAQLGRATGIHLVVATQRPSVDVVTGLIKANFPSRISFAVASQVDSRTILDMGGAERLLGRGDMLFLSPDAAKPRRVQGAYVSDDDTEALANHWRELQGPPVPNIDLELLATEAERAGALPVSSANTTGNADSSLYGQALDLASRERQLSTSLLQRRLRIGYPRAARLMDQLEDEGIVGPNAEPGRPRPVLYTPDNL